MCASKEFRKCAVGLALYFLIFTDESATRDSSNSFMVLQLAATFTQYVRWMWYLNIVGGGGSAHICLDSP